VRNTELCRVDFRDADFAQRGGRETDAGIRKVDLSPMLLDDLLAWRAFLNDPAPDSPFFPTRTGRRRTKDNVNARVLRPAVRRASERRERRGLPPLPKRVTAHTLRRTPLAPRSRT
jgi:integrase